MSSTIASALPRFRGLRPAAHGRRSSRLGRLAERRSLASLVSAARGSRGGCFEFRYVVRGRRAEFPRRDAVARRDRWDVAESDWGRVGEKEYRCRWSHVGSRRSTSGSGWPLVRWSGAVGVFACVLVALVLFGSGTHGNGRAVAVRDVSPASAPVGLSAVLERVIGWSDRRFWVVRRDRVVVGSSGAISSVLGRNGVRVVVSGGAIGLRLVGMGYGGRLGAVSAAAPVGARDLVRYRRGGLQEWYRNGPLGLEQGFVLARRPLGADTGVVTLAFTVAGSLRVRESGGQIAFVTRSGAVRLRYGDISARDAAGHSLRAAIVRKRRAAAAPGVGPGCAVSAGGGLVCCERKARRRLHRRVFGAKRAGEAGDGGFGFALSLSEDGDTALIGAAGDDGEDGAVWALTAMGRLGVSRDRSLSTTARAHARIRTRSPIRRWSAGSGSQLRCLRTATQHGVDRCSG